MAGCFSSNLQHSISSSAAAVNMDDMPFLAPDFDQFHQPPSTPSFHHHLSNVSSSSPFSFQSHPAAAAAPPPPSWPVNPFEGFVEFGTPASSSRSHSEAEKRRRDRINAQLATLRRLIPMSEKMDKAALLGSVVEKVKEMKSKATEMSKVFLIPSDNDEVTIDEYPSSINTKEADNNINGLHLLQASICCDDRKEVFSELNRALKSLRLTILQADMTSMGGRMKSVLVLCAGRHDQGGEICMNTVKQSLRVALSRVVTSCSNNGAGSNNYRIKSRRHRFFLPCDH